MKGKRSKVVVMLLSFVIVIMLGACGNGEAGKNAENPDPTKVAKTNEPVTLTLFSGNEGTMNEQQFETFVKAPVAKKYPYITLNFVLVGKDTKLENLVASGQVPDLVVNGPSSLFSLIDLGMAEDVTPLAKKNNFDFSRVDDSVLDFIRGYSDNKGLYSMPFMNGTPVMFYNKDIFDKFGVAYPKDYMTWNEVYEVAKKVVRNDGGTQYRAMEYFALSPYNQLSSTFVDPKTNKSLYNTPEWKKLIETWGQFYKIPGSPFKTTTYATIEQMFLKDGTLAMLVSPFNNPFTGISSLGEARNQFNWDIVTMPVFPEKPKTGSTDIPNHVMIAKQSKHKDEAFKVVETMLSDEVQSEMSRGGIVPVLKSQKVKDEFLKGVDFAKGKNVSAVFKLEHAPARIPSIYDGKVSSVYNTIAKDYYSGKKDINTVLREAEAESNKRIEAEMAQRAK